MLQKNCNRINVMIKQRNPFSVSDYVSPDYFCDRQNETESLISAIESIRNVALISNRRIGKTALIKHVRNKIVSETNYCFIYLDIMPSTNLQNFVQILGEGVIKSLSHKKNFLKIISGLMSSIRAKLVFDNQSGIPSLEFDLKSDVNTIDSLKTIFEYLAKDKRKYVIAIDEFQQILNYPERNIEAILRSHIQTNNKDVFIFSGSQKHMMVSMFASYSRPFYQSSDILHLESIDKDIYVAFILEKFQSNSKVIDAEVIEQYLILLNCHTFYVQYFFNRLFEKSTRNIIETDFEIVLNLILKEREPIYYNYRNLLTEKQFQFLIALANEGGVVKISSGEFIKKYDLPLPSTIKNISNVLLDKEIIYRDKDKYRIYDMFFEIWLRKTY